jgi:hypothetical protein
LNGFDAEAYCRVHPDLEHMLLGPAPEVAAQAHFIEYGYREGRFASEAAES